MIRSIQQIRLCVRRNLIFFAILLILSCSREQEDLSLRWENDRATAIVISENLASNITDPFEARIAIRVAHSADSVSILGNFSNDRGRIVFMPLIPFTRGMTYEVTVDKKSVGEVRIPFPDAAEQPTLLAIYPTQDTVPMNLLKMYLRFSRPMREGVAMRYVTMLKNNSDTLKGVFLDLHPELWNEDRTVLTLWLDPGRIKRDLQPNKRLGAPLTKGESYTLHISDRWPDDRGAVLKQSFQKNFAVTFRDSLSPDPKMWRIHPATSGSVQPLAVMLGAPLDYSLLMSTLQIATEHGDFIEGQWNTTDEERVVRFTPKEIWKAGMYTIQVETRLEDLAGNNVNRPFEVDLRSTQKKSDTVRVRSLSFTIK